MGWNGNHTMDPFELESRFAEESGMAYMDSIFEIPSVESLKRIEKVQKVMSSIPEREADFIDLYYFKKWKQTNIATLFGLSQPTISYRLKQATRRLRYLLEMPEHDLEVLESDLKELLVNQDAPKEGLLNVSIMLLMLETTCQTATGNILGITQGKVRHRFLGVLEMLDGPSLSEKYSIYAKLFRHVRKNLSLMWEVQKFPSTSCISYIIV